MKPEEIEKAQAELQNKMMKVAKQYGISSNVLQPIYDGVTDIGAYLKSNPKIMWILKEPYAGKDDITGEPIGGGDGVFDELWDNQDSQVERTFLKTLERIIYVTRGIDTGEEYDDMEWHYKKEMFRYLFQIAYINLSKMPAFPKSGNMTKKYQLWKKIVIEQVNLYNPDIIIFGHTFEYMKSDLHICDENYIGSSKDWVDLYKKGDQLFVDAYHPGKPGSTRDYVNSIVNIIRKHKI